MSDNKYARLSAERKTMQAADEMPHFWGTASWQLFRGKYLYDVKTPREQYRRIADTLAQYVEGHYPSWWVQEMGIGVTWADAFFNEMWEGRLSPSTPILSNTGTTRGFSVSCSGNVVENSVYGIYAAKQEVAVLTKNGFGTASYLGEIPPRGTKTDKGVVSNGVVPWIQGFVKDMDDVSQGAARRGAWAAYLPIEHGDFFELVAYLKDAPDGLNIGWNISNDFIDRLEAGDADAIERFQLSLTTKLITGKGYFCFPDKVNARRPQMYVERGLKFVAAQLCNEIHLHSSHEYTYTCVLASQNAALWDSIKGARATFIAHVFLDCVNEDFIQKAKGVPGMEKAVRFAEAGRPLGLGVCGFHTYLQKNLLPFDSIEAYAFNNELFKQLHDDTLEASKWLASVFGESEWCKGSGLRNTHNTAVAPTKSTALIMGGVDEGINPMPAVTYTQLTAAGEVERVNPVLLTIMKELGVYTKAHTQELTDAQGSCKNVSWLPDEVKEAFKTAFEIDQRVILKLAAARQRYLCQGQSLNLFFSADESEEYIAEITAEAFRNPLILGLYYFYSKAGVVASKGECESCQ